MTQLFGAGESECSIVMLWTYALASVALTVWSTIFMWLVAWLSFGLTFFMKGGCIFPRVRDWFSDKCGKWGVSAFAHWPQHSSSFFLGGNCARPSYTAGDLVVPCQQTALGCTFIQLISLILHFGRSLLAVIVLVPDVSEQVLYSCYFHLHILFLISRHWLYSWFFEIRMVW